jgi:hypothetical protein
MKPSDLFLFGLLLLWVCIAIAATAIGVKAKKDEIDHRNRCPCRDCEQWRIHNAMRRGS